MLLFFLFRAEKRAPMNEPYRQPQPAYRPSGRFVQSTSDSRDKRDVPTTKRCSFCFERSPNAISGSWTKEKGAKMLRIEDNFVKKKEK